MRDQESTDGSMAQRLQRRFHVPFGRIAGERGQSLVELALILPIALLLLAGAVDMGRLFFARVSIENAAREGAVFAANNPRCDTEARADCTDPNTVDWRAHNEATGLDGLTMAFTCFNGATPRASVANCETGDSYEVAVTDQFDFVTPLLAPIFGSGITLEATATSRVMNSATDPNAPPIAWPAPAPAPCTVPPLTGLKVNKADVEWEGAGFDKVNFSAPGMNGGATVGWQSIPAGTSRNCANASITVTP